LTAQKAKAGRELGCRRRGRAREISRARPRSHHSGMAQLRGTREVPQQAPRAKLSPIGGRARVKRSQLAHRPTRAARAVRQRADFWVAAYRHGRASVTYVARLVSAGAAHADATRPATAEDVVAARVD
jgi:hypothetical protein